MEVGTSMACMVGHEEVWAEAAGRGQWERQWSPPQEEGATQDRSPKVKLESLNLKSQALRAIMSPQVGK